jgi:2',3'-cyclic-nucleotide 2'-phosphodiesterase (5'-nucleotidase family)
MTIGKYALTRRSFLAALAATLGTLASWRFAWAQKVHAARVTFVLTNDIYLMNETAVADGKARGGFARLAAVIKAERAKGGHVIFAHGGDTLSPSLMSGFDRGAHIITLTNMLRPDIFVAGNHEFDFGKATFLERMAAAKFPLYAANLRTAEGFVLPGHKDRSIVEFEGVRVGLTGLAYDRSPRVSSPEDLRFANTIATAKAQAAKLREEGADFVVAVSHCDRGDALVLQTARAVDLQLTGHTHDLYVNFDGLNGIVESSYDGQYVVAVDVDITVRESAGDRRMTWSPQFRVIDTATVTPDADVAAAVARLEEDFSREMNVAIGRTAVELDSRNPTMRTGEAAIGNLFADAMRVTTKSDAAIINGGGVRAHHVYPAGSEITRKDILGELPFNNRVVVIEISGRELKRAIENGLAQLPTAGGRFPQVSGIKAVYDVRRRSGERVLSMQVAGKPLSQGRKYRVAILDFLARGGDDYTMLRDAKRITPDNDAPLLATEVMNYVRRLGTIRTGVEGRLVAR